MRFGRDTGVTPCGGQREYRVIGIVEGVNDVMRGAGMVRVLLVNGEGKDLSCLSRRSRRRHVLFVVAARPDATRRQGLSLASTRRSDPPRRLREEPEPPRRPALHH